MRVFLGRDISILNRVIDGHKTPLTLTELREQAEQQPSLFDDLDFGGCGCFVEFEDISE